MHQLQMYDILTKGRPPHAMRTILLNATRVNGSLKVNVYQKTFPPRITTL